MGLRASGARAAPDGAVRHHAFRRPDDDRHAARPPDGRTIALNATDASGKTRIWIRPLNALSAHASKAPTGRRGRSGRRTAIPRLLRQGKLKKVDISGAPPQKICDAPTGADGSWSSAGVILFDGVTGDPIQRVAAAGGTPVVEVSPMRRARNRGRLAGVLPDGRHYIYMASGQKPEEQPVPHRLARLEKVEARGVRSDAHHLHSARLPSFRARQDSRRPAFRPEVPEDGRGASSRGREIGTDAVGLARFSVSRNGVLAYRTGDSGNRLLWLDRSGKEIETAGGTGDHGNPAFSRAGDRLAFDDTDPRSGKNDIWVRDLARGSIRASPSAPATTSARCGRPTGAKSSSLRIGTEASSSWRSRRAAGRGEAPPQERRRSRHRHRLVARREVHRLFASGQGGLDILVLPTSGDQKPLPVIHTTFNELWPRFSPDGRFLVYQSNESGRNEVYVRTFPVPEASGRSRRRAASTRRGGRTARGFSTARPTRSSWRSTFRPGKPSRLASRARCSRRGFPRRLSQPVRGNGRRAALSVRRAARPRRDDADDRRPELVCGTGEVNVATARFARSRSRGAKLLPPFGRETLRAASGGSGVERSLLDGDRPT